ncbi:hypothetical protein [Streptomyces sp. SCSIO ZS0520]|uniref:hypothetical protein n=1 Tax=Streptomyces sp. SCSIO ZS0520 TaxID=2892996 RepID=UPI0021DA9CE1|nr:hypothetical protein [Streptomyces sp. SCSIO ZS0520]
MTVRREQRAYVDHFEQCALCRGVPCPAGRTLRDAWLKSIGSQAGTPQRRRGDRGRSRRGDPNAHGGWFRGRPNPLDKP